MAWDAVDRTGRAHDGRIVDLWMTVRRSVRRARQSALLVALVLVLGVDEEVSDVLPDELLLDDVLLDDLLPDDEPPDEPDE